jgi:uncharacterized protein YbjT (DUF2867 family)
LALSFAHVKEALFGSEQRGAVQQRVLVTGASGNVGREVVRACLAGGFTVRLGSRTGAPSEQAEVARFDFLDRSTWARALDGARFVFLLRPPAISDMKTTLIPFVDAAYAAGIDHLVFLSVAGAEKSTWVPHRKVELHLEGTHSRWTVLRPGFFAQNLQDAYRRDICEDDRLYVPASNGRVAFLDVRDAADVAARIFASPEGYARRALTLTGPEAVTFHQVTEMLSTVAGRPIVYTPASIPGYLWHLKRRRSLPAVQAIVQTVLHVGLRRGDAEKVDPTVENILGRPASSLRHYIERHAALWASDRAGAP